MRSDATNEAIVDAGWEAVAGRLRVPSDPGLCLALVRIVVEHALGMPSHSWYRWRTQAAMENATDVPWARDMERSLRAAGMAVDGPRYGPLGDPERYVGEDAALPGDLLFRWDAARLRSGAYVGHVGVLLDRGLVLENVAPDQRHASDGMWRGPTRLTPVGAWPVTTIIRFDPTKRPAKEAS